MSSGASLLSSSKHSSYKVAASADIKSCIPFLLLHANTQLEEDGFQPRFENRRAEARNQELL